ncbi:MAG TPA: FmdB family zinc ribbon protein [Bryobacteraceae bacterium]|nr:FmdB family zinc ribbon protein [Bryobacteraceae bacterium]
MPLYEYKCHSCGDVFEIIQKFSDEPLAVHENCGGAVERLISPSALQFKGSGWYVTDYGKGNAKPPKSGASNGEGKGAEGKTGEGKGASSSESSSKSDSGKSDSGGKTGSSTKSESTSKAPAAPKSDSK